MTRKMSKKEVLLQRTWLLHWVLFSPFSQQLGLHHTKSWQRGWERVIAWVRDLVGRVCECPSLCHFGAQAEKVEVKLLDFFLNEKSLYLTQPMSTTVGVAHGCTHQCQEACDERQCWDLSWISWFLFKFLQLTVPVLMCMLCLCLTQVLHLPLLPSPVPVRSFLPDPTEAVKAPDEGTLRMFRMFRIASLYISKAPSYGKLSAEDTVWDHSARVCCNLLCNSPCKVLFANHHVQIPVA